MSSALISRFKEQTIKYRSWSRTLSLSNLDQLNTFSLHKQATSGDCQIAMPAGNNVGEKAKWNAWMSRTNVSQADAMAEYIVECDRQYSYYGIELSASSSPALPPQTPTTTPTSTSQTQELSNGLASIPLLAAAASETQAEFMQRMSVTTQHNGWWGRQRPLATVTPTSPLFSIEKTLIKFASLLEKLCLSGRSFGPLSPSVLHSIIFPIHLTCLGLWIIAILLVTAMSAIVVMVKTVIYGARSSGVTIEGVFTNEILVAGNMVRRLGESKSFVIRLAVLAMLPLSMLADVGDMIFEKVGILLASLVYSFGFGLLWWYWLFVVPWLSAIVLGGAGFLGLCFGVVELAR